MPDVTLEHFERAGADIGAHGDNDTLPFDIDTRFVEQRHAELAGMAFSLYQELQCDTVKNSARKLAELSVFNERLLAPTGPAGFRISTKIHPFWTVYFNGLGIAIADALEDQRDLCARSYRFLRDGGDELFNRNFSWRAFREATVAEANSIAGGAIVAQTDISSFYEHISHHHVQNSLNDLFPDGRIGNQITALLGKFSAGRSFGLPVGGQASRVLAELFLDSVDQKMTVGGFRWFRYVDDYVLVADSYPDAYRALAALSYALADYGITLNKTKTVLLTSKHYVDYVAAQLGSDGDDAARLRAIDLYFDPYSDAGAEDYESLKQTVEGLQVQAILERELEKSLPDNFLVVQVSRTLKLQPPTAALQLVRTLLSPDNLHAFRASWSTIMRGIAGLRATLAFKDIFPQIDHMLDAVPEHSSHLLQAEASVLHYIRTLHMERTSKRATFVQRVYDITRSETVKRACIECWRRWKDRAAFTALRNNWSSMSPECQRLVWLAAASFGDQGEGFRRQVEPSLKRAWQLGIERQNSPAFALLYQGWCDDAEATA
ncbi:reverse transcriptase [Paraburkholderia phytofirmans OLGA172]|uniref:Reverse transcriptase n=1 Tax=Paraburkholderia phytofirmans OLGA172 TaxID=1417228 RepID=A0A160FQ16_9BURK|nr:RNA-directed DNA polymerase [Paraburkholderia phytofirmans]ANB74939.1 reverse transcriptase [Paraburkholderia phytofirmans OLGA172]